MQIKTFQAKDMAEALRMVKSEFGPDAMILTSKKMRRKGFFGLFSRPYVEVTALLDNRPRADFTEPEPVKEVVREPNTMEEFQKSMLAPLARELRDLRSRVESLSVGDEKPVPPPVARMAADAESSPSPDPRPGVEDLKRFLLRTTEGEGGARPDAGVMPGSNPAERPAAPSGLRPEIEELKQLLLNSMGVRKEQEAAPAPSIKKGEGTASEARGGASSIDIDGLRQLLLRASGRERTVGEAPSAGVVSPHGAGAGETSPATFRDGGAPQEFPPLFVQGAPSSGAAGGGRDAVAEEKRSTPHHLSEADDLKQALHSFLNRAAQPEPACAVQRQTVVASDRSQAEAVRDLLRTNGVGDEEVDTLMTALGTTSVNGDTPEQVRKRLHEVITANVICAKQMTLKNDSPRILAFVGPTGVGKTTTIAKLAAFAVKQKVRVSIVTIDTYRIGAVDQLKAYADIMGVPFAVAETPEELAAAITAQSDRHLILIDTAGRNPRDHQLLDEMKSFLEVCPAVETHLCLSATTRDRELMQIYHRFSAVPVSRILFTKLDESESFGCIINMNLKSKMPLSYFTTGQKVPDDLQVATSKKVADLILGEMTP